MKKQHLIIILLFSFLLAVPAVQAQKKVLPAELEVELKYGADRLGKRQDPAMQKFRENRLGAFIHWGLYALPARHEWIKTRERITEEEYERYFEHFNPDLYDPKEWARQAKAAGMKYAVLTAKHHEGFCLFDSKYTDYKATNTKAGRDLVREYVDAFRAEGLKIGFFYCRYIIFDLVYQILYQIPLYRYKFLQHLILNILLQYNHLFYLVLLV